MNRGNCLKKMNFFTFYMNIIAILLRLTYSHKIGKNCEISIKRVLYIRVKETDGWCLSHRHSPPLDISGDMWMSLLNAQMGHVGAVSKHWCVKRNMLPYVSSSYSCKIETHKRAIRLFQTYALQPKFLRF